MKITISERMSLNMDYIRPFDLRGCVNMISGILLRTENVDEKFKKLCNSAKFIFDDVEYFHPNKDKYTDDLESFMQYLKEVDLVDEQGYAIERKHLEEKMFHSSHNEFTEKEIANYLNELIPNSNHNNQSLVLSVDPFINAQQLNSVKELDKYTLLMMLATSGIDVALPSIFIKEQEEIDRFKEKFAEERVEYLMFFENSLDEMLNEIGSGSDVISDIYDFAKNQFEVGLRLRNERIVASVKKQDKRMLGYIYEEFLDRLPTIGAAAIDLDFNELGKQVLSMLLPGYKARLDTRKLLKENKEVAYIYRISEKFS